MDTIELFTQSQYDPITCVEMHTGGMPTRIVIKGYPKVQGTLLEQKAKAQDKHDHVRQRILLEPRGHADMFGAVLRPDTELIRCGKAHMGLLYIHRSGYSNMCGHATIAVSRFLIDTHDRDAFPLRDQIQHDPITQTASLTLHTPGGLVQAIVPTTADGRRSDPTRPVSFMALPSYALATDLEVQIPSDCRWPELATRQSVRLSIAYCSALSCEITVSELGFPADIFRNGVRPPFAPIKFAAAQLKKAMQAPQYEKFLHVPTCTNPGSIFGVMVTDVDLGTPAEGSKGAETGLYIFGEGIIDRSPTGSLAAARTATKFAKGTLRLGEAWTYHSLVTVTAERKEGLIAKLLSGEGRSELQGGVYASGPVAVQVQGHAYYTGFHTFVLEENDALGGAGFLLEE